MHKYTNIQAQITHYNTTNAFTQVGYTGGVAPSARPSPALGHCGDFSNLVSPETRVVERESSKTLQMFSIEICFFTLFSQKFTMMLPLLMTNMQAHEAGQGTSFTMLYVRGRRVECTRCRRKQGISGLHTRHTVPQPLFQL